MIKPYTNSNTNKVVYITPNSKLTIDPGLWLYFV